MRIDKSEKIELIASKDETRRHLNQVYLNVEDKQLVATDGHRMVIVPCEVDAEDTTGGLPLVALKEARRLATARVPDVVVKANGAAALNNGASYPRDKDSTYPPYKQVIPDYAGADGEVHVSFNAQYLWELCQALGGSKSRATVTVTFDSRDKLSPIKVDVPDSEGIGVLMPCRA